MIQLKKLTHFTIRQQLFIIYIPLIFISTILIGCYLVIDSTNQLISNYQYLADLNAQRVKSVLFDTTNTFNNLASSLSNDIDLRHLLSSHYTTPLEAKNVIDRYKTIDNTRQYETAIADITIYSSNQSLPNYQFIEPVSLSIQNTSWYQRALNQHSPFLTTFTDEEGANHLGLIKALPLPLSQDTAILVIRLDYNYLRNRLRNHSYYLELQLNDAPIFYSDHIHRVGSGLSLTTSDVYQQSHQKDAILGYNTLDFSNSSDQIRVYSADFTAPKNLIVNIIHWSAIVILTLILTLGIVIVFSRFFTRRISQLQAAVSHASTEDYDYLYNISGNDEISRIAQDFHIIIQNIRKKEETIFQAQLAEQELLNQQQQIEFKALSSQINPHFLFNTLETIRMTALTAGNKDVAKSIQLLATSMRNTLKTYVSELISFQEELDALMVYIKIQQLRFGDRVNFTYAIDETIDLLHPLLLPLTIQPLIENAIVHGLESILYPGYIHLDVSKIENDIIIVVEDNGQGISSEQLALIQKRLEQPSLDAKQSIGLANVHQRVKRFYGNNYGLQLQSNKNKGTTVTLTIHDRNHSSHSNIPPEQSNA